MRILLNEASTRYQICIHICPMWLASKTRADTRSIHEDHENLDNIKRRKYVLQ